MYRRESHPLSAGRNSPAVTYHRGLTGGPISRDSDENLDLFSRNRRGFSLAESDVSVKLGRLSAGPVKLAKSGMDDLLTSTDGGKHDYDWLLTPPGTPLYPSVDRNESQQPSVAPRSSNVARSVSTTKGSRLSVTQPESNRPSRPARSSSVTRTSVSNSQFNTYSNKSSSVLNTSSASVSSYIRPSTPTSRSARPSTPSSTRPVISSRPSTPSRARPSPASSSTRPVLNSRPSTPTSRQYIPANSNIPSTRSLSRPSTPTRRSSTPSLSPSAAPSSPATRSLSRPSSPSPRVRASPPQPMVLPDFSLETPPNLRTTLPDRPLSAGRSRPGVALTVKKNEEIISPSPLLRRAASPVVSRGRMVEPPLRGRTHANGQNGDMNETRKISNGSEGLTRKPVRPSATPTESTGFGRTISKKSLDMAVRHMDIKNGTTGIRPLSGSIRFPQSIRSTNPKGLAMDRSLSSQASANGNSPISNNGANLEDGNYFTRSPEKGTKEEIRRLSAKLSQLDIYESSRYDTILLKEDLKNTNWLLSSDEKSDQGPYFDHGFEPLPELFDL